MDTPNEANGDEKAEDDPSKKQLKRRRQRHRPKSRHSKNSDNDSPHDSGKDDNCTTPVAENDQDANCKHSADPTSEHDDAKDKPHQSPSREENSPDEDAPIIPETNLDQENLRRRLTATARSLKK